MDKIDEWLLIELWNQLNLMSARNGFIVERGALGSFNLKTNKYPYAKGIVIVRARSMIETVAFLEGYEQAKFEIENTINGE